MWKKFDAVENYDPKTKVPTKKYKYKKNGIENTIVLQEQTTTTINMNIGFYPKLITDFNVFYNGYDLFKDYTDEEVQRAVNNGLNIWSYVGSKLSNITQGNTTLTLNTKSVTLPANLEVTVTEQECKPTQIQSLENNYVIPSFGSNINESEPALVELIGTDTPTVVDGYSISGNESVFNGSVRLFWSAPNYGYFDTSKIVKPPIDSYMAKVVNKSELMSPFQLLNKDEYTKIDDLLSVFDRKTLDLFEEEFLKFSESVVDIKTGDVIQAPFNKSITDANAPYKNFQFFMRNMMKVPKKLSSETEETYFNNLPTTQFSIIQKQIENFLSYDVLLRMGNPYQYNKRVFNSFLSHQSNPVVVDPIKFEPYEQGTLPTTGGITLSESRQRFPEEWRQLELTVGFSTIDELAYKSSGSYITDFFIDNNIKFTTDNIEILQQLIRMYATQKLNNENIDSGSFKTEITRFLQDSESISDYFIDGVIKRIQGPDGLPNYSEVPPQKIQSAIDGQQSKVENWEVFKALNDKWIAGGDYSSRTIFEDMLFLDRASRNIGDTLLIDIFNLKDSLSKGTMGSVVQNNMSVLTFISGILINNNFTVMNLPAYVNFYNVTNVDGVSNFKPEGSLDFANNMWGTFLNVDYRNSGPKMVCFYVGKPSTYVALPNNKNYMFRDDGFDMVRSSENPLVENLTSKKDWALSNRCVGFNVDIGTRNQNIFYAFNVGQDNGKATSESIQAQLDIVNQVNGQNTSTQNVSLYNLYKQRSYTCSISSLGNALLQPTMYFNLRHVPMFYGPYMITEVTHTITPGSFQTQFSGVRQGMFDLPTIDKYLQSLNQNLLTKLEKYVTNKKDDSKPITSTTNQGKSGKDANAQDPKKQPENSCENGVNVLYKNDKFVAVPSTAVKLTRKELKDLIDKEISAKQGIPDPVMAATIYSICYFGTFNKSTQTFDSFNNNFSLNINLNFDFSPTYKNFFSKTYCCIKPKQETNLAIANFDKPETFIQFLYARLEKQTNRIKQIGLFKFYSCNFPINNFKDEKWFDKNKNTESSLTKIRATLNSALTDAKQVKIDVGDINLFLDGPKPVQAEGASVQNAPKCEQPTITRFEPLTASSSDPAPPITITGTNLIGNTQVFIGNQVCRIDKNTEKELVVVPQNKVSGKIKILTTGGSVESQDQFQFIFKNNSTNQSPPPGTTEYDKNLFTNAFALGEYLFTIGYQGGSKLGGRLALLNGTLSQNYEIKLFLRTSQTRVEITTFEILGGTIDKPTSYGDYLSKSTGWKETLSLASENNQLKSVNFEIYVPAFGLTKNVFKSIIPFDCPDESLIAYDIISVREFERISKDPCCECYYTGTGGKQIIINGVTCNPTGAGC